MRMPGNVERPPPYLNLYTILDKWQEYGKNTTVKPKIYLYI